MVEKRIKIYMHKQTARNGATFDAFHTFTKDNKKVSVRFRRECGNPPDSGEITIDSDSANLNKTGKYPVLWIKSYRDFKPFENDGKALDEAF